MQLCPNLWIATRPGLVSLGPDSVYITFDRLLPLLLLLTSLLLLLSLTPAWRYYFINAVIERPRLTGMGVIQCL